MKIAALGMFALLAVAANALAHHSPVVFDRSREVRIEGVVKDFKWSMPHSWIHLDVKDEKGEVADLGRRNESRELARAARLALDDGKARRQGVGAALPAAQRRERRPVHFDHAAGR